MFQSPSLRGSGRFSSGRRSRRCGLSSFNPLHCGAVVASARSSTRCAGRFQFQSPSLRGSGRFRRKSAHDRKAAVRFQSPSLRGSGRFTMETIKVWEGVQVSIPFIAGQWSLRSGDAAWQRHAPRGRSRAAPLSLSPSLRGSGRFL